jgi:hypothetical protein
LVQEASPKSVHSFDENDLVLGKVEAQKPSGYLMTLTQGQNESLKDYTMGFNQETFSVDYPT